MKTIPINLDIEKWLKNKNTDFVLFIDISSLTKEQNKGYKNAILIGIALSISYVKKVTNTPNYVTQMIDENKIDIDEFHIKEKKADQLADDLAKYITTKGYSGYSQSEKNILETGFYNEKDKSTPLPHKTIALRAGLGWIGKNNLLVTKKYGSAVSISSVLTDAPLQTVFSPIKESLCGNCNICVKTCETSALKDNIWNPHSSRNDIVDVLKCTTCLKCMMICPWTQLYASKNKF